MSVKRVKKVLALGMAAAMTATLFGCGGSTASENQGTVPDSKTGETAGTETAQKDSTVADGGAVTIQFTNFNASGGHEETLDKMYEAFHEENQDITVEIETVGYDDYFTQMQTRVAGGTAPDCYELNIENFAAYAAKGALAEITDVDTSGINQTALQAFEVDGKQYGVPGSFSNVVLIYNKDLFDQAGVSYPTDAWTWDDVQSASEKIKALGDDIYGINVPITYNEFFKVAAQYGGSLLNEDKTEFTINSPENKKAAEMMIGRIIDSNIQPTETQLGGMRDWDLFESGRLGMIPTGIWAFSEFTDACSFDWDICVEPGATQKATHFFSNAYVVNAESGQKEAASKWVNWLASSPTAAKIRLEDGWDLPAITDETVLADYLKTTPPENKQAVFNSLDYLVTPPVIEEYSMMSDIITEKLGEAASGKITAAEALDQAQKECVDKITLK